MKSDIQIQKDVIEQIRWDPLLNISEIGVSVINGIVTLSGHVDSYSKKIAAEAAAKKVQGVRAVAEDILVGVSPPNRRTDAEIADAILKTFQWDITIPHEKIKVKVDDGVVWLEGNVEWEYQRKAAENSIQNLAGIKSINNQLLVKPGANVGNVKQRIAAAFHRTATIDASKIVVEVDGTEVTLTGVVRSFVEKEDAERAAWSAPGVTKVNSQLQLQLEGLPG